MYYSVIIYKFYRTIIEQSGGSQKNHKKTKQDHKEIQQEIHQIQLEKNLYPEVAALLLCRNYHIPVDDVHEPLENMPFSG